MKTIKSLKDITALEVGDVVVFGDLEYVVTQHSCYKMCYLRAIANYNDKIFRVLNINKRDFIEKLGIDANCNGDFPETKSLEALPAIVSALFKEYEKQNELPKTWEEFCERNKNIPVFKLTTGSSINTDFLTHSSMDKNTCCSRQEAEAFLALMQLRQLRKAYVKDWEPDLTKAYFGIVSSKHGINVSALCTVYRNLSFPKYELANQFLTNFKDLLEIAKPLL